MKRSQKPTHHYFPAFLPSLLSKFFPRILTMGYLLLAVCYLQADEIVIEGDLDVEKNSVFGGDATFLGTVQVQPQGDILSLDPSAANLGNVQRYLNPDNGLLVTVRCSKLDASVAHTADTTLLEYGDERLDTHNAFSNGVFTAPYTALYSFEGLVTLDAAATIQGYKNDTLDDPEVAVLTAAGSVVLNTIVSLQIGETYDFRLNANATQTTTSTNLSIISLNVWQQPVRLDSVVKVKRVKYLTKDDETALGGVFPHPNPGTDITFYIKAVGGGGGGVSTASSPAPASNPGGSTTIGTISTTPSGNGLTVTNSTGSNYNTHAGFYGYGDGGGVNIYVGQHSRVGSHSKVIFGELTTDTDVAFSIGLGGTGVGAGGQSGADGLIEITWYE